MSLLQGREDARLLFVINYVEFSHFFSMHFFSHFSLSPLTPACDEHWPLFHIWRNYLWYSHQYSNSAGRKDLSNDIRSGWSSERSLRYALKCSEIWVKTRSKISCGYIYSVVIKNCPFRCCFLSWNIWSGSKIFLNYRLKFSRWPKMRHFLAKKAPGVNWWPKFFKSWLLLWWIWENYNKQAKNPQKFRKI